ncbi:MAG: O-antigen ligase family protein, partial [Candidatus Magasanikbacteria bacterium]|nr:O-antigen ligase family protein [Candidatus Magasanikbacteria bacterium]
MKYKEKVVQYSLYALLILPLVFTPFTMFPWQFGKTIIFQMIVEILLAIGVVVVFYGKTFVWNTLNFLDKALLVFLLILFISSLTGANFGSSFGTSQMRSNGVFLWLHFGVFYFLMRQFFRTEKQWHTVLDVIIGVSVLISLTALFQNYLPAAWRGDGGGTQFSGIIGNRAHLALYLILPIALALYQFLSIFNSSNQWKRWVYLVIGFGEAIILYFTGNRGAFLGLVVGGFFVLSVSIFIFSRKQYRLLAASGLALGCVIVIVLLLNRLGSGTVDFRNYYASGTAKTRLMAWNIALKGFIDRPLAGWGMNNFEVFFNRYFNPEFLRYGFSETIWDKPHNWFLEIADSAGVLGLGAYGAMLACLFAYLWRLQKKEASDSGRLKYLIIAGGLVAYLTALFFFFETINSLLVFFPLCAWIAFLYDQYFSEDHTTQHNTASQLKKWQKEWIVAVACVVAVIALYRWNIKPLYASYYVQKSSADIFTRGDMVDWAGNVQRVFVTGTYLQTENAILLASDIATADKKGIRISAGGDVVQQATERIAGVLVQQAERYKDNYVYAVWAGQAYLALGTHFGAGYADDAVKWFEEAVRRAPQKQEAYFFLGRAYLVKKDFVKSEDALQKTIALSPSLGEPYWFLGLVQFVEGKRAEGLDNMEIAFTKSSGIKSTKNVLYVIDSYALEGRYDKVVEYYNYLIGLEPENPTWYTKLAATYVKMG